jgi:purple acid phosphatase-like protein/calcineurin-like phosphoesterase family protein
MPKFIFKTFFILPCFLFSLFVSIAAKEPLTVYLTWQKNPESTMTIFWITPLDETSDLLDYKLKGDSTWHRVRGMHSPMPDNYPFWIHAIELTGLKTDSYYNFRLVDHKTKYKFHTMSLDPSKPIRFIDGGDVYHDGLDVLVEMNRQAAKLNPMFAIVGGDIAYNDDLPGAFPEEMPRWMDFLIAWKKYMVNREGCLIPIIPAIGNHDVKKKRRNLKKSSFNSPFFYSLFAFPGYQGYNVLDFGKIMSIFILDSDHTHHIEGLQTNWLNNALAQRQDIPHKFVSYHVAAFPSYRKFHGTTNSKIRKYWVPLFEKFGVNAVFEHHDHAYKRTWPLKNGQIDFNDGILYLGDGAWGVETPRVPKLPSETWYLARTVSSRHVILVTIHDKERHFIAVDNEGQIIDEVMSKAKL